MPKKTKRKISPEERQQAEQQWANLVAQFAQEWPIHSQSRLVAGSLLYKMKRWLMEWGQNKGCKGRWRELLRQYDIAESTAFDLMQVWQEHAEIPDAKLAVARKKPQQNGKNNLPDSGTLARVSTCKASVEAADDESADYSDDHRIGVECVFCLTMIEKIEFMRAVKALGPVAATQEMYKAVLAAAPRVSGVGA